jgi:hypothetical protein
VDARRLAAAVSFSAFFAVFALGLLGFAVLGYVVDEPVADQAVQRFLDEHLPRMDIDGLRAARGTAGLIALVGLPVIGLLWVGALRSAIRAVWRIEEYPGRFLIRWLIDLLALAGLARRTHRHRRHRTGQRPRHRPTSHQLRTRPLVGGLHVYNRAVRCVLDLHARRAVRPDRRRPVLRHGRLSRWGPVLAGHHAAAAAKMIEHLDPPDLARFGEVAFGRAGPPTGTRCPPGRRDFPGYRPLTQLAVFTGRP